MKDWNWIASRRNLSLEVFLSNVSSIEEALRKFLSLGIIPPEREILQSFFNENTSSKTLQTENFNKQPAPEELPPITSTKSSPTKYDDYDNLVIIETE